MNKSLSLQIQYKDFVSGAAARWRDAGILTAEGASMWLQRLQRPDCVACLAEVSRESAFATFVSALCIVSAWKRSYPHP